MVETGRIYGLEQFQPGKSLCSSPVFSSVSGLHFSLYWEFYRENIPGYCPSLQLVLVHRDGVKCFGVLHLSDAVFPGQILELASIESEQDY